MLCRPATMHIILQELRQAQEKLHSMMTLMGTEPGLRDALEERVEECRSEIDALRTEEEELKKQLVDDIYRVQDREDMNE